MKKLLLLIPLVFVVLACGGGKNDSGGGGINVALLDFANGKIGDLAPSQTVIVKNTLSQAAYLSVNLFGVSINEAAKTFSLDSSDCNRFNSNDSGILMPSGESCRVLVEAKPTNFARFTAFLDVHFHAQSYRDNSEEELSENTLIQTGLAKYQPALAIIMGSPDGVQIPAPDLVYEFPRAVGVFETTNKILVDETTEKIYKLEGGLVVRASDTVEGDWSGYYTLENSDTAKGCVVTAASDITIPAGGCNLTIKLRLYESDILNNPYFFIPIPEYVYLVPQTVTDNTNIQRIRMSVR